MRLTRLTAPPIIFLENISPRYDNEFPLVNKTLKSSTAQHSKTKKRIARNSYGGVFPLQCLVNNQLTVKNMHDATLLFFLKEGSIEHNFYG